MNINKRITKVRDGRHQVFDCPICGCFHPVGWNDDCRDDANRYDDLSEYARVNHVSVNKVEIIDADEPVGSA